MLFAKPDFLFDLEELLEAQLFLASWDCDIYSVMHEIIDQHNQYSKENGLKIEEKFQNVKSKRLSLGMLLRKDFAFLTEANPDLRKMEGSIFFGELYQSNPNAYNVLINDTSAIIFKTPLIHFIHSAFSKINMVTHSHRSSGCIPMHDEIMNSEDYSDSSLVASLINDLDIFYNENLINVGITPFHYGAPEDFCERVEGARRFVLAHELAHLYDFTGEIEKHKDQFEYNYKISQRQAESWLLELFCDNHGVDQILDIYYPSLNNLKDSKLFELENTLIGILKFFYVLELVEVAQDPFYDELRMEVNESGAQYASHPTARIRRGYVLTKIEDSEIVRSNNNLRLTLLRNVDTLNGFMKLICQHSGSAINVLEIRERLTSNGVTFARRLFNYGLLLPK